MVATCTGGERGSVLNPALQERPGDAGDIAEIRRREMARPREILGVRAGLAGFRRLRAARGRPAAAAAARAASVSAASRRPPNPWSG